MTYAERLQELMATPGLVGCALVESASGIVIAQAGQQPNMPRIAEAAVEFWRLHWRLHEYLGDDCGALVRQACFFEQRVLALMPWDKSTDWLLVFVGLPSKVDWLALQKNMMALQR